MTKKKRAPKIKQPKPEPLPPLRFDIEAVEAVKRLGETMRHIETAHSAFMEEAETAALAHAETVLPLRNLEQQLLDALEAYCRENHDRLTDGGKTKTIKFATGTCSWRDRPASVQLRRGMKVEDIIAAIEERAERDERFKAFLRTVVELDKSAMLKDPVAAGLIDGVKVKSAGEDFAVEPFPTGLSETVAS